MNASPFFVISVSRGKSSRFFKDKSFCIVLVVTMSIFILGVVKIPVVDPFSKDFSKERPFILIMDLTAIG